MKSMTGFASLQLQGEGVLVEAELQAVNRKHFELKAYLPQELRKFEGNLQRLVQKQVARGALSLRIKLRSEAASVEPNIAHAKELYAAARALAGELQIEENSFSEQLLLQSGELFCSAEVPADKLNSLMEEVTGALVVRFNDARAEEGARLKKDVAVRMEKLGRAREELQTLSVGAAKRLFEKQEKRMQELLGDHTLPEDFAAKELSLLADKVDVTEELVRLQAHLELFRETMEQKGPVGKKLDFTLQEIFREINTVCSKSQEVEMTHVALEMKTEVERIREQVQNIE